MKPLVPSEIDLRGLPFMPLDVNRLRDSELAIKSTGDAFRAAVLLWCASWNQVPAASLPDDDRDLAAYAGYGRDLTSWMEVKSDAMRGFVLCDDGRLYHPVVAEKALEAWTGRKEYREVKENENDRKRRERAWKKAAYAALRDVGVVPAWNEKTLAIRDLCAKHGIDVLVPEDKPVTPTVTEPVTVTGHAPVTPPVTVTGHGMVTAKRETGTGTGTGTGTAFKEQELKALAPLASPSQQGKPEDANAGKAARAARLPADWSLPDDYRAWAANQRPDIDPDFEAAKFRDHWTSISGKNAARLDWLATWRNWIRGANPTPKHARKVVPHPSSQASPLLAELGFSPELLEAIAKGEPAVGSRR